MEWEWHNLACSRMSSADCCCTSCCAPIQPVRWPLRFPGGALAIIEGWKERIDGAGQLGWGPERMTIAVRIACVAIAFDQRTSGDGGRPRQRAFDVLREFIISEHGALDPTIIAAFIRMLDH
ncbi:MAG TPA: hypothetical protein EYN40_02410 [Planctomycetes bacterium]|nr:hypothetical protein [Planctomycetota bacterium]